MGWFIRTPDIRRLINIFCILLFILAMLLIAAVSLGFCAKHTARESLYPMTVQVIELDRTSDVVVCIDGAGNVWEFYGCEDWHIGDFASLMMDDMKTPAVYDDEIVAARYAGF